MADKDDDNPFKDPPKYILIPEPAPRHIIPELGKMEKVEKMDEKVSVNKNINIIKQVVEKTLQK